MKILVQRASKASVKIDSQTIAEIVEGVVIFVGITHTDTSAEVKWLADKLVNLRIFVDDDGKFNHSLIEKKGEALIISQFTLYGDCNGGRRPSFTKAAPPELAEKLYELFIAEIREKGIVVKTGIFGAKMDVSLVNDGPVTLMLER